MRCPHCQTENPAFARTCINCNQVLARACSNCQADLQPTARFCMHCGYPVIVSTPEDEALLIRLAAAAPDPLVEKVRAAPHLPGERRLVTVLFVDVVGSTGLIEQVGIETWTAIMDGLLERITPFVYRYEGSIARLLGDSMLAFFGAPIAHEDDPERAVRAALDLISAGREYAEEVHRKHAVEFAIRACINTGQVVLGPVGDDLRYEYTAMGGTVNLVSRIKFAAQPMTVLVSENTYRFVAPIFECVDLGLIHVKGISDPVHVHQVQGFKDKPGRLRGLAGLRSPMVGRDTELTTLVQLCNTVRAGVGRVVLIVGEPGLGKTRLVTEWKAAVVTDQATKISGTTSPPPLWAEGRCLSYGQRLAYHLLIDLLRSIIGIPAAAGEPETRAALLSFTEDLFGESALDVYPYLGHLFSLKLEEAALERVQVRDPQALRTQYLVAVRQLFQVLLARRPMVLILEDLHWADPSSIELLIKLLPMASTAPVLFCLVMRPERDAPGWKLVTTARELMGVSLTELTVNALSETESRKLVANLLEIEALPERVRRTILSKSEGNPFFVEEVIRMLIEQGVIVQHDGGWVANKGIESVVIPDNLHGLLLARIDQLPEDIKYTLRVASVIGRQFPVKVLARVLGEEGTK